jgi:para-aminobenzoate synthetase component 1
MSEIRAGDYYQLNLLRYFTLSQGTWNYLAPLFLKRCGPMGAWLRLPDMEVFSMSPERFVKVSWENGQLCAKAEPIKGTAPRHKDPVVDQKLAQDLLDSPKNCAELAMIIDLMRNDLHQVAISGSVQTPKGSQAMRLETYSNVHHLIGTIDARLKPGLPVGSLLEALCPAGSITGAPKKTVIQRIADYEKRPRGYFMGHVFWMDDVGQWDSSILIRTMLRQHTAPADEWEFAAGSGIVIKSDPQEECDEIYAKASIVTHLKEDS